MQQNAVSGTVQFIINNTMTLYKTYFVYPKICFNDLSRRNVNQHVFYCKHSAQTEM